MMYPWYSEEACTKMCVQFVNDHPQKDMDLLRNMATVGNIDEFRTLCNCLYVHQYTSSSFYSMSYDESRELRDLCNTRVHGMLGEHDDLYRQFFKIWKSERWGGDESWRLFCDAYKPFDEAKAILTLIDLGRYIGQPLITENLPKIYDLYAHGRFWELYVENTYSYDIEIPSEFKKANKGRKEHTLRWRKFMSYIWEGDFVSGQQIIDLYDKEHALVIEEYQEKNS